MNKLSPPECVASDAVKHYTAGDISASVASIEMDRRAVRADERAKFLAAPGSMVGGEYCEAAIADFRARADLLLALEQEKASPDNALLGFICNAVRISREYERAMRRPMAT